MTQTSYMDAKMGEYMSQWQKHRSYTRVKRFNGLEN